MRTKIFPTAADAESAFYDALERADLEAMMEVWAEDEDVVCVHPGGPRIVGYEPVRASWQQIFSGGPAMRAYVTREVKISGTIFAVHSVHENFMVEGEARPRGPVASTNVYLRTAAGWRMIAHHASPAPGEADPPPAPTESKRLH